MQAIRGNRIAMIFQEPMNSLNPSLTVGLQVAEPIHQHRGEPWARALDAAKGLLQKVRIPDAANRLHTYPHQYSGGMRQRAMIAMALACQPRLIIADEPTTALDVTVQAQILDLLQDLTRETGAALVLITHDLGVVARYAERVVVMYGGRVVEQAPARELYAHAAPSLHPRPAGLGAAARPARPAERLVPIDGSPPDLAALPPGCAFAPRCALADAGLPASRSRGCAASATDHLNACIRDERHPRLTPGARGERAAARRGPDGAFPHHRAASCCKRQVGAVKAVDGVSLHARARRDAGPGRRERLRQVHHRPRGAAHAAGRPRGASCSRARTSPTQDRTTRALPPPHADGLPGPVRLARIRA